MGKNFTKNFLMLNFFTVIGLFSLFIFSKNFQLFGMPTAGMPTAGMPATIGTQPMPAPTMPPTPTTPDASQTTPTAGMPAAGMPAQPMPAPTMPPAPTTPDASQTTPAAGMPAAGMPAAGMPAQPMPAPTMPPAPTTPDASQTTPAMGMPAAGMPAQPMPAAGMPTPGMPTTPDAGQAAMQPTPTDNIKPEQLGEFEVKEDQPPLAQTQDTEIRKLLNKYNELSKQINTVVDEIKDIRDKAYNLFSTTNNSASDFLEKIGSDFGKTKELLTEQK